MAHRTIKSFLKKKLTREFRTSFMFA